MQICCIPSETAVSPIPDRTALGEPLLSPAELALALGMSRRWVYEQVYRHGLPAYKLGRSLAFELSAVRAWLAARRIGQWPESSDTHSLSRQEVERWQAS
jgi:excisionase family DNA binding protein